jgi:hypothetical protein
MIRLGELELALGLGRNQSVLSQGGKVSPAQKQNVEAQMCKEKQRKAARPHDRDNFHCTLA